MFPEIASSHPTSTCSLYHAFSPLNTVQTATQLRREIAVLKGSGMLFEGLEPGLL